MIVDMTAAHQQTETTEAVNWRLELLGSAKLLQNGMALEPLERRAALLFAYLALEGPTPRAKLAGLIWSDSTEDAARANLRQRLKRLKNALGAELIVAEETLRLRQDLEVDVIELESLTFTGEYAKAMQFEGELLANLEPDDSPELTEWLNATRERLRAAQREALVNESERLEDTNISQALELALRLLENDVLSEDAYQRVMRLQYLRGDRSSALKTFDRLKTTFERELGMTPLPQTLELLQVIERGEVTPQHAPKVTHVTLQRPPVLIGREHEWAQLEAAWANDKMIVISGEAGAGKTRLAMDFLQTKGHVTLFEGRPGDSLVSYSTNARIHRYLIAQYNTLPVMPEWIRLELSRILPELGTPPSPIQNEADKLRFYQAKTEACMLAIRAGGDIMLLDDLQFVDNGTFESGIRMWSENVQNGVIKGIIACREAELNPFVKETLQQAFDAGQAVHIKLSPLEAHEVQTLLESLGVEGLERFGKNMHQATGGNPMFVLETARTLVTNGVLEQSDTNFPLPASVSVAIRARLSTLSAPAMRLARVASIAETDFNLDLAATVLDSHVLDLTESISELESAQVMQGLGFTHDLIAQTTLEGLPSSVRNLLHERIAVYLEKTEGNAARVAHHWIGAGLDAKAVPHLMLAGEQAALRYEQRDSASKYGQAAAILEALGDTDKAFEAYQKQVEMVNNFDLGELHENIVERLCNIAKSTDELSAAWTYKSRLLNAQGKAIEAEQAARVALEHSEHQEDRMYKLSAISQLKSAVFQQGERFNELIQLTEESRAIALAANLMDEVAVSEADLGVLFDRKDQRSKAIVHHERAIEAFRQSKNIPMLVGTLANLAACQADSGHVNEAMNTLDEIQDLLKLLPDDLATRLFTLLNRLVVLTYLNRFAEAIDVLTEIVELQKQYPSELGNDIEEKSAALHLVLGAFEKANKSINQLLENQNSSVGNQVYALIYKSQIDGKVAGFQSVLQAESLLKSKTRPLSRVRIWLMKFAFVPQKEKLELLHQCMEILENHEFLPIHIIAKTRQAQYFLEIEQAKKALGYSKEAAQHIETSHAERMYKGEVLLTHCQALNANKHQDFKPFLEKTLKWVLETANNHVPTEYRESFLTKNPHNAAILELAKNAGLEIPGFEEFLRV
jgi:DNA-binding SARP family transcriptional activator/CRISPR/Cas system-associated endonuclease Cas3-HD